jgi:hypothetical protein
MPYTYDEVAWYYHGSVATLRRKVSELKKKKIWQKKGKLFTEKEAIKLGKLLEFTFIPKHNNNGTH